MKYSKLWIKRELPRGTFYLFAGIWRVRVKQDATCLERPFAVIEGSKTAASFKTLPEAKIEALRRMIALEPDQLGDGPTEYRHD